MRIDGKLKKSIAIEGKWNVVFEYRHYTPLRSYYWNNVTKKDEGKPRYPTVEEIKFFANMWHNLKTHDYTKERHPIDFRFSSLKVFGNPRSGETVHIAHASPFELKYCVMFEITEKKGLFSKQKKTVTTSRIKSATIHSREMLISFETESGSEYVARITDADKCLLGDYAGNIMTLQQFEELPY